MFKRLWLFVSSVFSLITILLILTCLPCRSLAWNLQGHRIISQIAYDNLKPAVRRKVDQLVHNFPSANQYTNLSRASTWPDRIKGNDILAFSSWHYTNELFSADGTRLPPVTHEEDVVWAIQQSAMALSSPRSTPFQKAMFLRFLVHFVEDAHQPLHCVSRVSHKLPFGDRGGNLFPVHYHHYQNLHSLWDDGVGIFTKHTKKEARILEKKYPASGMRIQIANLNPVMWVNQNYDVAKNIAYQLPENSRPTPAYIAKGKLVSGRLAALAGYRLAHILNLIFTHPNGIHDPE